MPDCILGTAVGYMNPKADARPDPSYEEVCEGDTGYVEVVHIIYDSTKAKFSDLVKFFFSFHDPTTQNKQGNDKGTQYRSIIFYHTP